MKCKYCGNDIPEGDSICPVCGLDNQDLSEEAKTDEEITENTEEIDEQEKIVEEESIVSPSIVVNSIPERKSSKSLVFIIIILVIFAVAILSFVLGHKNEEKTNIEHFKITMRK